MGMDRVEYLEQLHLNADIFHPGLKLSLYVGYH